MAFYPRLYRYCNQSTNFFFVLPGCSSSMTLLKLKLERGWGSKEEDDGSCK